MSSNIFCYCLNCVMLVIDIVHKFIEKAIKIKRELVNVYKTILKKALEERGRERSSV